MSNNISLNFNLNYYYKFFQRTFLSEEHPEPIIPNEQSKTGLVGILSHDVVYKISRNLNISDIGVLKRVSTQVKTAIESKGIEHKVALKTISLLKSQIPHLIDRYLNVQPSGIFERFFPSRLEEERVRRAEILSDHFKAICMCDVEYAIKIAPNLLSTSRNIVLRKASISDVAPNCKKLKSEKVISLLNQTLKISREANTPEWFKCRELIKIASSWSRFDPEKALSILEEVPLFSENGVWIDLVSISELSKFIKSYCSLGPPEKVLAFLEKILTLTSEWKKSDINWIILLPNVVEAYSILDPEKALILINNAIDSYLQSCHELNVYYPLVNMNTSSLSYLAESWQFLDQKVAFSLLEKILLDLESHISFIHDTNFNLYGNTSYLLMITKISRSLKIENTISFLKHLKEFHSSENCFLTAIAIAYHAFDPEKAQTLISEAIEKEIITMKFLNDHSVCVEVFHQLRSILKPEQASAILEEILKKTCELAEEHIERFNTSPVVAYTNLLLIAEIYLPLDREKARSLLDKVVNFINNQAAKFYDQTLLIEKLYAQLDPNIAIQEVILRSSFDQSRILSEIIPSLKDPITILKFRRALKDHVSNLKDDFLAEIIFLLYVRTHRKK